MPGLWPPAARWQTGTGRIASLVSGKGSAVIARHGLVKLFFKDLSAAFISTDIAGQEKAVLITGHGRTCIDLNLYLITLIVQTSSNRLE